MEHANTSRQFLVSDGLLCKRKDSNQLLGVVPSGYVSKVLSCYYDSDVSGHLDVAKTRELIGRIWW